MVRWHHRLNGQEFEQTPRDSEGQRSLACCSPQGCKAPDTTQHTYTLKCLLFCKIPFPPFFPLVVYFLKKSVYLFIFFSLIELLTSCILLTSALQYLKWRRKWQTTPVFLPGESCGWRSLVGCCPWGRTESDMTEATQQQQQQYLKNKTNLFLYPL